MPFLADGRPVDVVLNPLGVPSRMNVGQILETHLGWAAKGVGELFNRLLDEKGMTPAKLKERLKKTFTSPQMRALVDELDEEGMRKVGKAHARGVYISTPVFDGAKETEIREMLKDGGLAENGQSTLFDGKTGEAFDQ